MAPVLQKALPIVGSALGRKMCVRVEVSGNKACTDGECIWIPAFDLQRPEQERLAWGYLCAPLWRVYSFVNGGLALLRTCIKRQP